MPLISQAHERSTHGVLHVRVYLHPRLDHAARLLLLHCHAVLTLLKLLLLLSWLLLLLTRWMFICCCPWACWPFTIPEHHRRSKDQRPSRHRRSAQHRRHSR